MLLCGTISIALHGPGVCLRPCNPSGTEVTLNVCCRSQNIDLDRYQYVWKFLNMHKKLQKSVSFQFLAILAVSRYQVVSNGGNTSTSAPEVTYYLTLRGRDRRNGETGGTHMPKNE